MTVFFTNDFAEMFDDAGQLIAMINPSTIVDSVGEERPDAIKVQDRIDPLALGWVARDKLVAEPALAPVAPKLEVPRFIEAAQDAANTVNIAFGTNNVQLSDTLLLIFAWLDSGWENVGGALPVPTGAQPATRFGPFGFLPAPWVATIANPKYAEILRDFTAFSRIDPYLQCYVAACLIHDLQTALHAITRAAPNSTLIRIAYLLGVEEGCRFAQLAQDAKVDTAVGGQPALSAATIAAHGDLLHSGDILRTRAEVEATVTTQLTKAATAAADKAAEFLKPLGPLASGTVGAFNGPTILIDDRGLDLLSRVAMSEVGHFGKYGPAQLEGGLAGVVDTIISRVAHPKFPNSLEGVVNASKQFSAINNIGTWERLPAPSTAVANIVKDHVAARCKGRRSEIRGAINFLNPFRSSPSALSSWGQHVVDHAVAVYGNKAAKDVHYHGFAPGTTPPPPYALAHKTDLQYFSGTGDPLAAPTVVDQVAAIIASATKEWAHWGKAVWNVTTTPAQLAIRHRDNDPELARYVLRHYCALVNANTTQSAIENDTYAWSAACLSFILMQAGITRQQFKFSESHSTYIRDAVTKKKASDTSALYWGYRVDDPRAIPEPGDIIGHARPQSDTDVMTHQKALRFYDETQPYKSHADIVVAKRPGQIDVIGGNVQDSVTMKTLHIETTGHLGEDQFFWFVVMKRRA